MPPSDNVKVVVRCRPLSEKEISQNYTQVVHMYEETGTVVLHKEIQDKAHDIGDREFTFDHVYGPSSTQGKIYEETCFIVIDSVLRGYNGTIFAYGQTGTGKTHTMTGPELTHNTNIKSKYSMTPDCGVIPRAFQHIFDSIKTQSTGANYSIVRVSFLEIYNEEIRDLLSKKPREKLELKEHPEQGVYVKNLSAFPVESVDQMIKILKAGTANRATGITAMSAESSRSHSIFSVIVESYTGDSKNNHIRVGKLNLVDLAGSERQSKTGATGDTLKEATKINQSLSALGNVISALVNAKSHFIPYRDSKLTRLLEESLGGNTKTLMIANVGPAEYNFDESLSTLRYANRAKNIKNKPRVNEDPQQSLIRGYVEEIARLKDQLKSGGGLTLDTTGMSVEQIEKERARLKKEFEKDSIEKDKLLQSKTKEHDVLVDQLKKMEAKMLQGSKVIEKAVAQELELKKAKAELEQREIERKNLERSVKEKADAHLSLQENYNSQSDAISKLYSKLEKLWHKYKQRNVEYNDLETELANLREESSQSSRELKIQNSFLNFILCQYVPPEYLLHLESQMIYDEVEEVWKWREDKMIINNNNSNIDLYESFVTGNWLLDIQHSINRLPTKSENIYLSGEERRRICNLVSRKD